jgi:hypothetical protein
MLRAGFASGLRTSCAAAHARPVGLGTACHYGPAGRGQAALRSAHVPVLPGAAQRVVCLFVNNGLRNSIWIILVLISAISTAPAAGELDRSRCLSPASCTYVTNVLPGEFASGPTAEGQGGAAGAAFFAERPGRGQRAINSFVNTARAFRSHTRGISVPLSVSERGRRG